MARGSSRREWSRYFPRFPRRRDYPAVASHRCSQGIAGDGSKKSNFEPGIDLHAKVTVFGEGSRGSLTKEIVKHFYQDADKNPAGYEVGVKEVWELPETRLDPGEIIR